MQDEPETANMSPIDALSTVIIDMFPGLIAPRAKAEDMICRLEAMGFTVERVRWASFILGDPT